MTTRFEPRDYPLALETPDRLNKQSFWLMHIPFAFALTQMLRPRVFVELGAHRGDSYLAFCQAVDTLGLDTRCFAVDTWAGDVHTGGYSDEIYDELRAYHDARYGNFSTLVRSRFDDALEKFEDGTIDLLHIDGTHTYEAVRHDFESWLPKLSERGVIIMHDIAEYQEGFGVWRVWDEIKSRYPQRHFEFPYGSGLGVVGVGSEIPEPVRVFFEDESRAAATAHYFSMLGERVQALAESADGTTPAVEVPESRSLEDVSQPEPRVLAFYLPQFHPVPENDLWWGKGFTEWTNVMQAKPLFPGHYQPHIPADLGFYDLRLPETRQAQADLAREHGIHGFCYFHYWFGGRRILERPLDEMLALGQPDFPFCLCWANATWTLNWHSEKPDRLIEQEYSEEDDREHIRWLVSVFKDKRYIKVGGRPLMLIYRPQDLPDPIRTITLWKQRAKRLGVAAPYIVKVEATGNFTDPREMGCDASVEFPPHQLDSRVKRIQGPEELYRDNKFYEYRDRVEKHLERATPSFRRFPCVMPGFDNTPRHRDGGATIYHGSTPELYEQWLAGALEKASCYPPEEQLVFVNAWNEWAEGNHLEPDLEHGRAYLEATRRILESRGIKATAKKADSQAASRTVKTIDAEAFTVENMYQDLLGKYVKLQQRLTDQLRAEENSAFSQKLREKYQRLERRHKDLQTGHKDLQARNRELKEIRNEAVKGHKEQIKKVRKLLRQLEKKREETDKLVRWIEQLDAGILTMLSSQRWKLGNTLGEAGRKALLKPRVPPASDQLLETLNEYRTWRRSGSGQRQPRKKDADEGANSAGQVESRSNGSH